MVFYMVMLVVSAIVGTFQSPTLRTHVGAALREILLVLIEINPIKLLDAPLKTLAWFAANAPVRKDLMPIFIEEMPLLPICLAEYEDTFKHFIFLATVGVVFVVGVTLSVFGLAAYARMTRVQAPMFYDENLQLYQTSYSSSFDLWQTAIPNFITFVHDADVATPEPRSAVNSVVLTSSKGDSLVAADRHETKRRDCSSQIKQSVDEYLAKLRAQRDRGESTGRRESSDVNYSSVIKAADERLEAARRSRLGREKFGVASTSLSRHVAASNSLGLEVHESSSCRIQSQVLTPSQMRSEPKLESAAIDDWKG